MKLGRWGAVSCRRSTFLCPAQGLQAKVWGENRLPPVQRPQCADHGPWAVWPDAPRPRNQDTVCLRSDRNPLPIRLATPLTSLRQEHNGVLCEALGLGKGAKFLLYLGPWGLGAACGGKEKPLASGGGGPRRPHPAAWEAPQQAAISGRTVSPGVGCVL